MIMLKETLKENGYKEVFDSDFALLMEKRVIIKGKENVLIVTFDKKAEAGNITYNHTLLACEDEVVCFNENIETPEFNEILRSNKVKKEFWLC